MYLTISSREDFCVYIWLETAKGSPILCVHPEHGSTVSKEGPDGYVYYHYYLGSGKLARYSGELDLHAIVRDNFEDDVLRVRWFAFMTAGSLNVENLTFY